MEMSCLQNHYCRFVEICEYHGGAQRGGICILEGFQGKNWDRFVQELYSFFLGKVVLVETHAGKSRNVKGNSNLERRDTRAAPAPSIPESRKGKLDLEPRDTREFKKELVGSLIADLPRCKMNPNAPRPTCQCDFKWEHFNNTLRITKLVGEKRQAKWLGLKHKAIDLAQLVIQVVTQAQDLDIGLVEVELDQDISEVILESSPNLNDLVNHDEDRGICSSDDEVQAFDVSDDASEPLASPRKVVAEPPELSSPINEAWVDLVMPMIDSRPFVKTETHDISDSQYEYGQSSNWMVASKEVEGWASLAGVGSEDTDGELASPL